MEWRDDEVIARWTKLYKPSPIVSRYLSGTKLTKAELEDSDFTSIQERIRQYRKTVEQTGNREEAATTAPTHLLSVVSGEHQEKPAGLSFSLPDYLELTDWAGRAIREDKSGAIPTELAPILERLNIDPEAWLDSVRNHGKNYNTVI